MASQSLSWRHLINGEAALTINGVSAYQYQCGGGDLAANHQIAYDSNNVGNSSKANQYGGRMIMAMAKKRNEKRQKQCGANK